jgi:hypothetical protein
MVTAGRSSEKLGTGHRKNWNFAAHKNLYLKHPVSLTLLVQLLDDADMRIVMTLT